MRLFKQFLAAGPDVATGLLVGFLAALVLICLEESASAAERHYRETERLLVIVARAAEAGRYEQWRDGGASSRLAADRPGADSSGRQGHLPAGVDGHDHGDVRSGHPTAQHNGSAARMIVE